MIFHFEDFELDTEKSELRGDGTAIPVEAQVFALLVLLIENRQRLVSRDEIIEKVWDGRFISDSAVASRVKSARQALNDDGTAQRLIQTVHGRGFRFVGDVSISPQNSSHAHADAPATTEQVQKTPEHIPSADKPSLSILPFARLAKSNDLDHLADGLAEELIASLSKSRWLFVIAAGSSRRYRNDDLDPRTVANDLNVRYLIQGSFMQMGPRIRIIVKLIDGLNGIHLDVFRTQINYDEIFFAIEELTTQIAGKLLPGLTASEWQRVQRKLPSDLGAWELYLSALNHIRTNTEASCSEAKRLLFQAVSRAPDFAAAHARLSTCFIHEGYYGWGTASKSALIKEAFRHARQACAADGNEALAYDALASAHQLGGEYEEAISLAQRAIEMSPTCMAAYGTLVTALAFLGRTEDAIAAYEQARIVSPQDPDRSSCLVGVMIAHFVAGRYGACMTVAREHLTLRPNWYASHMYLAAAAALQGDEAEAQLAAHRIQELLPNFTIAAMRKRTMLRRTQDIDHLERGLRLAGIPMT